MPPSYGVTGISSDRLQLQLYLSSFQPGLDEVWHITLYTHNPIPPYENKLTYGRHGTCLRL